MDIIGFNAQIKRAKKAIRPGAPTMRPGTRPVIKTGAPVMRPGTRSVIRPGAPVMRPGTRPVIKTGGALTTLMQRLKTGAPITRPGTRPAQIRLKKAVRTTQPGTRPAQVRTQKTASNIVKRATMRQRIAQMLPNKALIKQDGKIVPVNLTRTTNRAIVTQANPIQRSFMPVDLPYQNPIQKSKLMNVAPGLNVSINTDMIVPSVDAGIKDYYGK